MLVIEYTFLFVYNEQNVCSSIKKAEDVVHSGRRSRVIWLSMVQELGDTKIVDLLATFLFALIKNVDWITFILISMNIQ